MLTTTSFIKRHINSLKHCQLVATRDLLCYGSRTAVDKAVSRLVKSGFIERVARGVFMRLGCRETHTTLEEIALTKARAFGKIVVRHDVPLERLTNASGEVDDVPADVIFDTSGYTSSFRAKQATVHFKKVSPRKIKLGDTPAGVVARSLWHLGKLVCSEELVRQVVIHLHPLERTELRESAGLIPAWLNEHFRAVIKWRPRVLIRAS